MNQLWPCSVRQFSPSFWRRFSSCLKRSRHDFKRKGRLPLAIPVGDKLKDAVTVHLNLPCFTTPHKPQWQLGRTVHDLRTENPLINVLASANRRQKNILVSDNDFFPVYSPGTIQALVYSQSFLGPTASISFRSGPFLIHGFQYSHIWSDTPEPRYITANERLVASLI